ncbi:MAG: YihY/virulence factor BrkB family protein [Microbacterium sp.]|uniref:YihY/virulence factor BrkB family protein n=1 Tax=Microbacterium sp. TaxID=51671 RepID=UPI0019C40EAB|nr:YihY/virulence factor BrkB family protein [Microbacterium sp.]MBD3757876.1 YihY/virulence factor BrkB family protein [Microbacterium sp.]
MSNDRWRDELRERFDEPIERATEITRRTLAWFPIRVWRHFLRHNGFLLAAAISYQSLFAIFAVLYTAFAIVGVWLGGSQPAIDALISIVNSYIPGIIGEAPGQGLVTRADVAAIAQQSASVLAITGAVAFLVALWTAIGFVTFTRRAVRDIFGLRFDSRNYVLLKARDFVAAALFGLALVLGAALSWIAGGAVELIFDLLGLEGSSGWVWIVSRISSILVAFALNTAALAGLIRFLTGTSLQWRLILPGAALGGGAMIVLQFGAGLLLYYSPSNPLLATFSVVIGFLLWFRLVGIVILVAASWVALTATDADVPIIEQSEDDRRRAEYQALLLAAQVRLRDARDARAHAAWWQAWTARADVRRAEDELARVEASAPPPPPRRGLLD